jgi:hypothetical protein
LAATSFDHFDTLGVLIDLIIDHIVNEAVGTRGHTLLVHEVVDLCPKHQHVSPYHINGRCEAKHTLINHAIFASSLSGVQEATALVAAAAAALLLLLLVAGLVAEAAALLVALVEVAWKASMSDRMQAYVSDL